MADAKKLTESDDPVVWLNVVFLHLLQGVFHGLMNMAGYHHANLTLLPG